MTLIALSVNHKDRLAATGFNTEPNETLCCDTVSSYVLSRHSLGFAGEVAKALAGSANDTTNPVHA